MIKKLFSPFGRLSRGGMWLWNVLIPVVMGAAASYLDFHFGLYMERVSFSKGFQLFYLWPGLVALPVKRFHDLGISGFVYLVILLFFYGFIFVALGAFSNSLNDGATLLQLVFGQQNFIGEYLSKIPASMNGWFLGLTIITSIVLFWLTLVSPGQPGENRYGSDPLER